MSTPTAVHAAVDAIDADATARGIALVDGLLDTLARGACDALTVVVDAECMDLFLEEDRAFGRVLQGNRAEGLATVGRLAALAGITIDASWIGEGSIQLDGSGEPPVVVSCRIADEGAGPRAELRARRLSTAEQPGMPRVPGYRMIRQLGRGATAEVFEARHGTLGRPVAIKVLFSDGGPGRVAIGELLVSGRFPHANLVDVLDAGTLADGRPFLVMELVAGPTLRARLDAGPIGLERLAAVVTDVARALDALHAAGLVHNDVKPDNIFTPDEGAAKLADLGAARLTGAWSSTGVDAVFGTPLYIAPEYARGGAPGPRADVYSLGCVIYEALAGRPPFAGTHAHDVLIAHLTQAPPALASLAPGLPGRLVEAVHRALAKDAAARFASAGELAAEIAAAVTATRALSWRLPWKR